MKTQNSQFRSLMDTYLKLKNKIKLENNYVKTNKILDVKAYVEENEKLHNQLLEQILELNNKLQTIKLMQKKRTQSISKRAKIPMLSKSKSIKIFENPKIHQLKNANQYLRKQIQRLKEQSMTEQLKKKQNTLNKQQQVHQKQLQLQGLLDQNKHLNEAIQMKSAFDLYELKCRQCVRWRQINNQRSEKLKEKIVELNKLAGTDENPNSYLMNLKI